jgi:hypothetical protein
MRTKILPLYCLIGVIAAGVCGFLPNPAERGDPEPFLYAGDTVLTVCGLMVVQTLLLMAILRPATFARSWGRALLALVVCLAFLALGALGSMHSPPAWGAYTLWLLLLLFGAFGLLLSSASGGKAPDPLP